MGMDSQILAAAARITAPLYVSATARGEITVAIAATHAVMLIPDWMAGRYCEFTAYGASVDLLCGLLITTEVVYGQTSSIDAGTKAVTTHAKSGRHIVDGTTRSWLMPAAKDALYFSWEGSGTGVLQIGVASMKILP